MRTLSYSEYESYSGYNKLQSETLLLLLGLFWLFLFKEKGRKGGENKLEDNKGAALVAAVLGGVLSNKKKWQHIKKEEQKESKKITTAIAQATALIWVFCLRGLSCVGVWVCCFFRGQFLKQF